MTNAESKELLDKITAGVLLANKRMIEKAKQENQQLVYSKDGKIIRIHARDLR